MPGIQDFRAGKPDHTPDQSIYAEYASTVSGLTFQALDGGDGQMFEIRSSDTSVRFAAGRCSWYPQNTSTAASLATDKYFAKIVLERAGVPTLGGDYFFLHERHRAHRASGHERSDALACLRKLGDSAFVKPLLGSRGDFAQAIRSEAGLKSYLDEVSRYYDSIVIQPIATGLEYRIFVLDDEVLYSARKYSPAVVGDGISTISELLDRHNTALQSHGLSTASRELGETDAVLPAGIRKELPGRMNLSVGGTMVLEKPDHEQVVFAMARQAARALGLRVAAIDIFVDADGVSGATKVIEVNSNPSIRVLEQSNRDDLILKIWHHTFVATGLLRV